MNYLELTNRFWREVDLIGATPHEIAVYFRLLDICNRLGWKNPFTLSNTQATSLMGMSEKSLSTARQNLMQKGLIAFKPGSRRTAAPTYCFPQKGRDGNWTFADGFTSAFTSAIAVNQTVKTAAFNKHKHKNNNYYENHSSRADRFERRRGTEPSLSNNPDDWGL